MGLPKIYEVDNIKMSLDELIEFAFDNHNKDYKLYIESYKGYITGLTTLYFLRTHNHTAKELL